VDEPTNKFLRLVIHREREHKSLSDEVKSTLIYNFYLK